MQKLKYLLHIATVLVVFLIFLLPSVQMLLYYGFKMQSQWRYNSGSPYIFGLTIAQIFGLHCAAGFVGGLLVSPQKWLASGFFGALFNTLTTAFFMLYLFWRKQILIAEILFPLTAALIITIKCYEYYESRTRQSSH
jgi:hypothetical protein